MIDPIALFDAVLKVHFQDAKHQLEMYKNHVQRVYNLCLSQDQSEENRLKYAIAAVFHDIGIWSKNTFDYIEPSIIEAKMYLEKEGHAHLVKEVSIMIEMHHKRSAYTGENKNTVEVFRMADWMDVSLGLYHRASRRTGFGIDKKLYSNLTKQFPYKGFHYFLLKQTFKNFLKNPMNPLPMFLK